MKTVFDTILSMYSVIVTEEMATMYVVCVFSRRSPSKHKAEQTALDGKRMKTKEWLVVTPVYMLHYMVMPRDLNGRDKSHVTR